MGRRVYQNEVMAAQARAEQNRNWHKPFIVSAMPWRVIYDGKIVAVFVHERDARGFAKARYGDDGYVEARTHKPVSL